MRTSTRALTATIAIGLAVVASGCGGDKGSSAARGANRNIDVTMTDNAFQPTTLRVTKGETVTIKFKNDGAVRHEAILGDDAAQAKHHAEMTASTAQTDHGSANHGPAAGSAGAITVEPGKTGELTHTFNESGTILIGCHEPGHWEAGMKATVTIA